MKLPMYVVSAFARDTFSGNPAAVVPTPESLGPDLMQAIAAQNNLAETAFVVLGRAPMNLRWFTPKVEVDLCGHATLAAAHVLWTHGYSDDETLRFATISGDLAVRRSGEQLQLDFPARPPMPHPALSRDTVAEALACRPSDIEDIMIAKQLVVVLKGEEQLANLTPRMGALAKLHDFGVMVTALGQDVDFVARFFAPNAGIDEDPVTGSAYTTLGPYWSQRLNKVTLQARQLSARGGDIDCEIVGSRVLIGGRVQSYLVGEIEV